MEIHQPHDKLFKVAFSHKKVAYDFISVMLDAETLEELDLDSLTLINSSHVDKNMRELRSDVVY